MRRAGTTRRYPVTERRAPVGKGNKMVRRSSYRLGRRLKSSRKDRLDYITYINSTGMPSPKTAGASGALSVSSMKLGGNFGVIVT